MDKAIINNKIVSAYEISLDYESEKLVRAYSRNKKILCVDSCCKNPVLRYCHGDKKAAYFAHLTNTECDYDKFDKNDTPFSLRNNVSSPTTSHLTGTCFSSYSLCNFSTCPIVVLESPISTTNVSFPFEQKTGE